MRINGKVSIRALWLAAVLILCCYLAVVLVQYRQREHRALKSAERVLAMWKLPPRSQWTSVGYHENLFPLLGDKSPVGVSLRWKWRDVHSFIWPSGTTGYFENLGLRYEGLSLPLNTRSGPELCKYYLSAEPGWVVVEGSTFFTSGCTGFVFRNSDGRQISAAFYDDSGQVAKFSLRSRSALASHPKM